LLCRDHGVELEILFYSSHHFLKHDYIMFDCGGMAFGEAGFQFVVGMYGERIHTSSPGAAMRFSARTADFFAEMIKTKKRNVARDFGPDLVAVSTKGRFR
jgi:hypothetical protein